LTREQPIAPDLLDTDGKAELDYRSPSSTPSFANSPSPTLTPTFSAVVESEAAVRAGVVRLIFGGSRQRNQRKPEIDPPDTGEDLGVGGAVKSEGNWGCIRRPRCGTFPSVMGANGSAKKRKKARPPQAISSETWKAIETACVAGMGYSEAARRFGINVHAVIMRSRRSKWAVPSRILERAQALQANRYKSGERYKPREEERTRNEQTTEALAQSWAEKGEQHRALAFELAHSELREAARNGLPIGSWRDADLADKAARRSAGLDDRERSQIEVNLALVNARLETMEVPNLEG
jgi:muconolactone delta-isomerase